MLYDGAKESVSSQESTLVRQLHESLRVTYALVGPSTP